MKRPIRRNAQARSVLGLDSVVTFVSGRQSYQRFLSTHHKENYAEAVQRELAHDPWQTDHVIQPFDAV